MPTSAIDSLIFRDIFGNAEMRKVWSDEFRILSVRYRAAERESASVMLYSYLFSALTMAAAIAITG